MRIITAYDEFRSQLRSQILALIARYVADDTILAPVETPDGGTELWDITFKDEQQLRIEIKKTA